MRKTLAALAAVMLFISGCANENKGLERAMALRTRLLSSSCRFTADITADYGDTLSFFSMECQADSMGNISFTILEPESIRDITGTLGTSGGALTFDEEAVYFDLLADSTVSPVSAPWIFLMTLRGGYLTGAGEEGKQLHVTIADSYEDDALQLDIWLDGEDVPVQADILYDGRRIMTVCVRNFSIG